MASTTDEVAWREAVTATLKGRGPEELGAVRADGIRIEPLYTERHTRALEARGVPGEAPFVRGSSATAGFRVVQRYDVGSLEAAEQELRWDLAGGTEGVWIAFDQRGRGRVASGSPRSEQVWGVRGVPVGSREALASLLAPVELDRATLVLEVGAAGAEVVSWLEAICAARGLATSALDLVLLGDPLATLAELGELPLGHAGLGVALGELVRARAHFAGDARTLGVSGLVYQEAGASCAEQLGLVLAGVAEALRLGRAQALGAGEVLGAVAIALAADEDVFATIALVRATRLALAKLGVAAGLSEPVRPRLLGLGSARSFTVRDAQDNLLRATAQSYGLGVGGVDLLATLPFDHAAGRSDRLARRVARNQAFVLREEGHVARVADPAGGAYYLEALTEATARAAWEVFREVEREGGLSAALVSGSVQARLARSRDARAKLYARRKRVIVGLSEFALPTEAPALRPPKRAARASGEASSLGLDPSEGALRATPLALVRDAEPFETLRDRADALAADGRRPRALLVALGEASEHRARVGFARRFFEVGGFELAELELEGEGGLDAGGHAATVAAADVVCLCSSDARYAELGAPLLAALGRAGARQLTLAGRPGALEPGMRAAGLAHALFLGCDAPEVLGAMLEGIEKARGGVS